MPERTRISVERYQKMVAAGIFTDRDRIELIDGEMINLSPIGSNHAALSAQLTKLLVMAVGDTAIVFVGGPVNLGNYSEPQPDLMLLRPRTDFTGVRFPRPGTSCCSSRYPTALSAMTKASSATCMRDMASRTTGSSTSMQGACWCIATLSLPAMRR